MELEVKLLLGAASRDLVESHPAFAAAERRATRALRATYYDDEDRTLHKRAASLRVREAGGAFVQTVKTSSPADAFASRSEWEWPVDSVDLDTTKLADLPGDAAWIGSAASRFGPVFTTEIDRDTWLIELDGGTVVEAVIDIGIIRAGDKFASVGEVELELKRGGAGPLFELAADLADRADLRYGVETKAERGYALLEGTTPAAVPEPAPRDLDGGISVGEAFPLLVAAALREFAAEMPAAAAGDVEGVHRLRAAIRKLRTLLVLFAPHLERGAARRFNAALRNLGTVLGGGRDWDVFLTETLPSAREDLPGSEIDLLAGPAEERRRSARAAIAAELGGPLPTRLILGLGAWTAREGWLKRGDTDDTLADGVPDLLDRLHRKVRKRSRHLDDLDSEGLHALRKAMKKLRYATEDVGSLFEQKSVKRYHKAIKAVLSLLGEINDDAVTETLLDEIAPDERPELAPPAAALGGWAAGRRKTALHKLKGRMQAFEDVDRFWR